MATPKIPWLYFSLMLLAKVVLVFFFYFFLKEYVPLGNFPLELATILVVVAGIMGILLGIQHIFVVLSNQQGHSASFYNSLLDIIIPWIRVLALLFFYGVFLKVRLDPSLKWPLRGAVLGSVILFGLQTLVFISYIHFRVTGAHLELGSTQDLFMMLSRPLIILAYLSHLWFFIAFGSSLRRES